VHRYAPKERERHFRAGAHFASSTIANQAVSPATGNVLAATASSLAVTIEAFPCLSE
jgi:hypothetical protein